jgi:hypothetical protein
MGRRKKGAVRRGRGAMCNICGRNCGKGGGLRSHIIGKHDVTYEAYNMCFYGRAKPVIADAWDDSVMTAQGVPVVTHVLVRRFIRDPGRRGVPRAANPGR